jgi:hypothetical protein
MVERSRPIGPIAAQAREQRFGPMRLDERSHQSIITVHGFIARWLIVTHYFHDGFEHFYIAKIKKKKQKKMLEKIY